MMTAHGNTKLKKRLRKNQLMFNVDCDYLKNEIDEFTGKIK